MSAEKIDLTNCMYRETCIFPQLKRALGRDLHAQAVCSECFCLEEHCELINTPREKRIDAVFKGYQNGYRVIGPKE